MTKASPFIDVAAVEAWDAWFRWRQRDDLRDLSIQDTWARVSRTLACGDAAPDLEHRLAEAQESWRLLFDERLLRSAGTETPDWPDRDLVASINLAALITNLGTDEAWLDMAALETTSELAVQALDNAAQLAQRQTEHPGAELRIGVIGLADALLLIGVRYESARGRELAHAAARHLAAGCLRGSLRLAAERGARWQLSDLPTQAYKLREISPDLAAEAERTGLRHTRLTSITSQPRLALLANNVTDAVDPFSNRDRLQTITEGPTTRTVGSPGYAVEKLRRLGMPAMQLTALTANAEASTGAQMDLRAAMQMWIDQPILYPLCGTDNDRATQWNEVPG